ncbi:MAG: fumarylacetoacetate hydrolase family protein [Gammaproteobacteria bacterium]|nr:fumarylacetoacetate hydrolase family protein [Gammaproteobacteria bacterium]
MERLFRIPTPQGPRYLRETAGRYRLCGDRFETDPDLDEQPPPATFLPPAEPPAIFCIGLNYRAHADEMGAAYPEYPVVFMKSPNTLTGHQQPVALPKVSQKVDYEGELAVIIGKSCHDVSVQTALDHVLGYTIANDVSARDWQKEWGGGQFCRGKSFDGFCPLGPGLLLANRSIDPQTFQLTTRVNGKQVQASNTSDMIFSVAELIAFLSQDTTLLPGSLILTGTPGGVGMGCSPPNWLQGGDRVTIGIDPIGELHNHFEPA